jgi:hypothetical protein
MERRKIIVAALAGLTSGCGPVESDSFGDQSDGGPDAAIEDTESGSDTDIDSDADADGGTEDDAGGCSGVTCYEAVGPAVDQIGLSGIEQAGVLPVGRAVLTGSFAKSYATQASYRIVDDTGAELAAGDLGWRDDGEGDAVFELALPDTVGGRPFELFLYGTCLKDVRELDSFPARRYLGNRRSDNG